MYVRMYPHLSCRTLVLILFTLVNKIRILVPLLDQDIEHFPNRFSFPSIMVLWVGGSSTREGAGYAYEYTPSDINIMISFVLV